MSTEPCRATDQDGGESQARSDPQLPGEFVTRIRAILPADVVPGCLQSFREEKSVGFRVNTLKSKAQDLEGELTAEGIVFKAVPFLPEAYLAPPQMRPLLVKCRAFREGRLYIQDLSSMLAVAALDPQPGEEILDLAAAPGGKACHIAARMENRGRIAAVDVVRKRLFKLRSVLQTAGVTISRTYLMDGRQVGAKTSERFDRVLLDAPCSSEARFSESDPETYRRWSLRKIAECARKQKGLLASAIRAVKPGGVILYCTCSFSPEENEAVVDAALRKFGNAIECLPLLLPVPNTMPGLTQWEGMVFHPDVQRAVRILPTPDMDGFFLCRLIKTRSLAVTRQVKVRRKRLPRSGDFRRKGPNHEEHEF